jgi:LemA protein
MSQPFPPLDLPVPGQEAGARASVKRRWLAAGIVATAALASLTGISQYNGLQSNDARVGYCWHQVINQYTRRADLVPNLVAVVRSYAQHESALLTQIAETRSRIQALAAGARDGRDAGQVAQFQAAQGQLTSQLGRLLQVAEAYPELRSSSLYEDLMVQLEGTENRLEYARQQYFASIADYNLALHTFPSNLIAQGAGMHDREPGLLADERVVRPAAPLDLK